MKPKYSLIIRWSDEDNCYIAWVPEFGTGVKTHGSTYEEAARAGQEVIELVCDEAHPNRLPMPEPWLFTDIDADDRLGRHMFPTNIAYQESACTHRPTVKHASA